jgi:site-specific DNA-methyltransferase (adenine-specific)
MTGCAWDVKIDLTQFWVQVKRLMRDDHTPILMFCSTKFGFDLYNSNPDWFRYDLVWEKSRAVGFLSANKMPLRSHELIYVFSKKGAKYYRKDIEGDFPAYVGSHSAAEVYNLPKPDLPGYKKVDNGKRCVKSVVSVANESNKGRHPTQKPAELYAWLIERYSKEGDTILDPTAGSFASVFTAERMGRIGIGIEMNEEFYNQATRVNLTDK